MPGKSSITTLLFASIALMLTVYACHGAQDTSTVEPDPEKTCIKPGWKTPITAENTGVSADELHFEGSPDAVEGHTIEQIVTSEEIQIRADATCVECHDWAKTATRESFCEMIDAFMTTDQEGAGPKPQLLKDVLSGWQSRGCPE